MLRTWRAFAAGCSFVDGGLLSGLWAFRQNEEAEPPGLPEIHPVSSDYRKHDWSELVARAPPELQHAFDSVVDQIQPAPGDALALLDAIDGIRSGLGVAIGRGETGEDRRYQDLVRLVDWLYLELGSPQDSRYAVVRRAVIPATSASEASQRPAAIVPSRADRMPRIAHAAWAAACIAAGVLLVLTGRHGHPPAIILLPLVLVAWAAGHGIIWCTLRLLAAGGRRIAVATDRPRWPPALRALAVGTGLAAVLGVVQLVGTVMTGGWYPFRRASEWAAMLLVWAAHGACFAGLLLRRGWSRRLGAILAFLWAALLCVQIIEHVRSGVPGVAEPLIIAALIGLLLILGAHLLYSRRIRSFMGE
jgi:hypothetical protein